MSPAQIQRGSGEGSREEEVEGEVDDQEGGGEGDNLSRPLTGASVKSLSSRPTSVKI